MAAKDGVISANERRLLREFAEEYEIDVNYLYRLAYAQVDENEQEVELIGSNEIKGRRFEEFVVSLLDDKKRYKLLAWRSDKISGNVYATENLYPDLHISHIINDSEERTAYIAAVLEPFHEEAGGCAWSILVYQGKQQDLAE